jgi:hypothetical protein
VRVTVTYEQARDLVRARFEPGWTYGTFCLDDRKIVETDDVYAFQVGAREFLVEGDESYETVGGVTVVYKADGRLGSLPSVAVATDPSIRITENPQPVLRVG